MRLSEAIRLGATLHRQAFHSWSVIGADEAYYTCALGAAVAAMGASPEALYMDQESFSKALLGFWPALNGHQDFRYKPTVCPECRFRRCGPAGVVGSALVVHLNDNHRWSRERIADWLATSGCDVESAADRNGIADVVDHEKTKEVVDVAAGTGCDAEGRDVENPSSDRLLEDLQCV